MESIQQIKGRINSVSSTRQITQSMHMVSSSKIVKSRARMVANREFLAETQKMVDIASASLEVRDHLFLKPKQKQGEAEKVEKAEKAEKAVMIVLSSDRGLCGSFNANVCKEAHARMKEFDNVKIITVGSKGKDYFRRRKPNSLEKSYTGLSEKPFFEDAADILDPILEMYHNGEIQSVYLVYTKFVNMLTQLPTVKKLLPVEPDMASSATAQVSALGPETTEFLEHIVPFYIKCCLFGAMLEASVCEQSSRVASMDTAVKNAEEMIGKLTLTYNKARQSSITQEMIEIIGGAKAVQKEKVKG